MSLHEYHHGVSGLVSKAAQTAFEPLEVQSHSLAVGLTANDKLAGSTFAYEMRDPQERERVGLLSAIVMAIFSSEPAEAKKPRL
jgi:hypothetical protein